MGILEDFLNRLEEHAQAQRDRLTPSGPLDVGIIPQAFLQPARAGLDTIGLGLEGTGQLGKMAFGEASFLAALAQVQGADRGLPFFDPNSTATQVSRQAVEAGPLHPRKVQDILREGPDSLMAWLAGAGEMAADPSNIIPFPVAKVAKSLKGMRAAKVAGAGAELTDDFFNDLAKELEAQAYGKRLTERLLAEDVAGSMPRQLIDNPEEDALAALRAKRPLDEIFGLADKAKAVGQAGEGLAVANERLAGQADIYKDVQAQKQAAVREALDEFRVNGRLPRNFKATPVYQQRVDETKNAVELLNPQGPQNRATFGSFGAALREDVKAARGQQRQAQRELQAALGTQPSPLSPGQADLLAGPEALAEPLSVPDSPAVQRAIASGVDPEIARARSKGLGEANATFNQAEQQAAPAPSNWYQTPAGDVLMRQPAAADPLEAEAEKLIGQARADKNLPQATGGFFKDPFQVRPSALPVAQKTLDNPEYLNSVKQQGTAIANLAPPPTMYPELEQGAKGGRLIDLINHAFKEGLVAQKEAYSRPWKKVGLSDIGSVWYGVNIQTVKNLLQDPIFAKFVLRNEGIAKSAYKDNEKIITTRLTRGEKDPLALFGSLGDVLKALGLQADADPKTAQAIIKKLGGNPFDNEAEIADHLNGMQQALIGAGLQLANPVRAVTGVLTGLGNLAIPMRARMFHIINNVTHVASRVAAWEHAAFPYLENGAKVLLERAAAEGKDISSLAGRKLIRGGEELLSEGLFDHQEVLRTLGPRYAAEWKRISEQAMEAGYEESRRVLGNYQLEGNLGAAERQIKKFVPLQSWAWRAYPRAAKYALQHPAVTAGLLQLYELDRQVAQQEHRPGYLYGTVSIDKDTPFVGLLASVFTPEQEAELRFNPLSLFNPLGGETLSMGAEENNPPDTAYQKAKQLLGYTGASFNPLIQEGMYLTGQDYQAPSPGSRYSPIDLAAGTLTGITAPTIAGPNKALRAGITKAMGDEQVDTFDPVRNKANELVFEITHKVVSDPSNRQLALDIENHGPFYQEAQRLLDIGGGERAAFNALSPVSVTARTETTKARQAATGDVPFSYEDIKAAQDQGLVQMVRMMKSANDQYYAQHPEAAVNKRPDIPKEARVDPRLAEFEKDWIVLKHTAPKAYARALKEYKDTLGIR